jgi:hypothetical protein
MQLVICHFLLKLMVVSILWDIIIIIIIIIITVLFKVNAVSQTFSWRSIDILKMYAVMHLKEYFQYQFNLGFEDTDE